MNQNKLIVYVVPHTHWDREWYLTQATFQMMNVDMMDRLLAILRDRPEYTAFLLDGQLIALEDYLSVCPGRREEIAAHVRTGRLAIGPWYVLPDEYLASGEAHIRNFMEGMRVAEGLGGGERIGYLPDSFGHPAQVPQLIDGLGMREMVFWRGPGPEVKAAEFRWQSPDGTEVLALNMAYGYSNAACLPEDRALRTRRLDHEIGKLKAISALNLVLLMNGSDHIAPDPGLPAYLAAYREERPGLDIRQAQLRDYLREAHRRAATAPLQTVAGELRSGYRAYLLGDTLSTRMPLKQRQRAAETLVESWLEPALVMLSAEGRAAYPAAKLRYLWRQLLQNLPHDSICGCGIDPVHEETLLRYRQIEETGEHLLAHVAGALRVSADDAAQANAVTVFNHQPHAAQTPVTVRLTRPLYPLRYVDYEQDQILLELSGSDDVPLPTGIDFMDADGVLYPGRILRAALTDTVESSLDRQPLMRRALAIDAAFVPPLPPLGYASFGYRLRYDEAAPDAARRLENEYFVVEGQADGTLDVCCKQTGRWLRGLGSFRDVADVGDEYTLDALPEDAGIPLDAASVRWQAAPDTLTLRAMLSLPIAAMEDRKGRAGETVACPVTMTVTLPAGVPRIDVETVLTNKASDHCVTARFPLGQRAERCLSDSLFSIDERPLVRDATPEAFAGWKELPNNTFFQKNFACLIGKEQGLAVFVRGLPQLTVQQEPRGDALVLTLLRCVGWLSRPDLRSRDGNGGWTVETPGAQEQGTHRFAYAIRPFGPDTAPAALYREAEAFASPPLALETGAVPGRAAFVRVDHEAICCSALKQAEAGDGYVLRLHNMSAAPVRVRLWLSARLGKRLQAVSLDERFLEDLPAEDTGEALEASLAFRPWQILSLRLMP